MKKFLVYVDDGCTIFKFGTVALSEKEVREANQGLGEIVAVKDVTVEYCVTLSAVDDCLSGIYGKVERGFILSALRRSGLFED